MKAFHWGIVAGIGWLAYGGYMAGRDAGSKLLAYAQAKMGAPKPA